MKTNADYSDLDVLYAVYKKLYDFLEELLDQDVIVITPARNAQYRAFVSLIEDIAERPENQGIDCFLPEFDDLHNPLFVEEGDIEWKFTISPNMLTPLQNIGTILSQRKISGEVTSARLAKELKRVSEASVPAFTVTFPNERTIMVNDYQLSKPHFNSRNEQIFSYIYRYPNTRITREDLLMHIKSSQDGGEKKTERVLRDLGFDGMLLRAFFPHLSISAVFFRNPVRYRDLASEGIDQKQILDFLKEKRK